MKSQPKHPWCKKSSGQEQKRSGYKRCEIKLGSQGLAPAVDGELNGSKHTIRFTVNSLVDCGDLIKQTDACFFLIYRYTVHY